MTEAEWLGCTDPQKMLEYLRGKTNDRKLRLFGSACVGLVWSLAGEKPPLAVRAAEGFADRLVTKVALRQARQQVRQQRYELEAADAWVRPMWGAYWLAEVVASENAHASVVAELNRLSDILILEDTERSAICNIFRDVFSNPFQPVSVDPTWLAWNAGALKKLAQVIYDERQFDDMPILADALEDAGCDNADILEHCRGAGPHVRGCWVLDLLLGKC